MHVDLCSMNTPNDHQPAELPEPYNMMMDNCLP
jgi:hypothetical protein